MTDQMKISGPVRVESDSKERVAFDLMVRIDHDGPTPPKRDEKYFLSLYARCLRAAKGLPPEESK